MKSNDGVVRIYTDGSAGGRIAWLRQDTQERHGEDIPGLTNNEAEYHAVLSALNSLPNGTRVEVMSDSTVCVMQLLGKYRVLEPRLADLKEQIVSVVANKKLAFTPTVSGSLGATISPEGCWNEDDSFAETGSLECLWTICREALFRC